MLRLEIQEGISRVVSQANGLSGEKTELENCEHVQEKDVIRSVSSGVIFEGL